jgi:hypothetical protein
MKRVLALSQAELRLSSRATPLALVWVTGLAPAASCSRSTRSALELHPDKSAVPKGWAPPSGSVATRRPARTRGRGTPPRIRTPPRSIWSRGRAPARAMYRRTSAPRCGLSVEGITQRERPAKMKRRSRENRTLACTGMGRDGAPARTARARHRSRGTHTAFENRGQGAELGLLVVIHDPRINGPITKRQRPARNGA